MGQQVYKELFEVMKNRRGPYSGVDVPEFCPPEALIMGDNDVPAVNLDRCFGCAVCATGCPSEAIVMESKPDFPVPPKDPKE